MMNPYKCDRCNAEFWQYNNYVIHMKGHGVGLVKK